jgi:PAS domain S-box-containing protein
MAGESIRIDAKRSVSALALKAKHPPLLPFGRNQGRVERLDEKQGFEWVGEALTRTQEALQTLSEAEELHRLLFVKLPQPRFVCDARTLRILAVNEATVRQYKYSRSEFHQMKVTDLCAPESLVGFKKYCQGLSSPRGIAPGQDNVFRHRRKDGGFIEVEIEAALIPMRGRRIILLLAQDVTETRRAQQRLRAQQATTHALAESYTMAEAGPKIFRAICENLGGDWGELWSVDPVANVLRCTQTWHPASQRLPRRVERATRDMGFARGEGLPGSVWARNQPLWIPDITQQPSSQRTRAADKYGLRTVFAFPIRLNQEVLGVITVFSQRVLPPDKHLLQLLKDICSQIGQVMGRRRAEGQLLEISEREQQRIGRDLHDGLCQQLAGIAYIASNLQRQLASQSPSEAGVAGRIAELSRATAVQARQIARGLNPVNLGTTGLVASLDELASSIGTMFSISCRFESDKRVHILDHGVAVHLYRITQEAIHNGIIHGKATEIHVSLRRRRVGTVLSIVDNGRGLSGDSAEGRGMGFENMNCRARAIDAKLQIASCRGGGTIISCTLPYRARRQK